MGALELRDSVLQYINTADERLLKVVKVGKPITRAIYKEELASAKLDIKNGNVISQEDLEKESENW